jgi:CMP-N-acetylneuraminic acid synthetase
LPEDVAQAYARLKETPEADGIIAVSEPHFSPIWHGVVDKSGWMAPLFPDGEKYARRQDLPKVYRINGLLYIWRTNYLRTHDSWKNREKHLLHIVPELRATSIDNLEEFQIAEALIKAGLIQLPWLKGEKIS